MSARVVRPLPVEKGPVKVVPDPVPRLAHCRLTVDATAGTAEWVPDKIGAAPVTLAVGTGPGQFAGLVRAVYPGAFPNAVHDSLSGRVLLVDGRGTVVARSAQVPQSVFDQAWPIAVLRQSGLPVTEKRFKNTRLLHKAHRGAAPLWPLTAGYFWFLLTITVVLLLAAGLATILVQVTGG